MSAADKFDTSRANEYEQQSRIALAGYDACHDLSACLIAAALGPGGSRRILAVGAGGGGKEIATLAGLEPDWRFTAVDPSAAMMEVTRARMAQLGLTARVTEVLGEVEDDPADAPYDAATLIGVLHHLPGVEQKRAILAAIAARLAPGAPFILACNRFAYESRPLLLAAWAQRWRMNGDSQQAIEAKLGKIQHAADPPANGKEIADLLDGAGFGAPELFFSSLFWGAWVAMRR